MHTLPNRPTTVKQRRAMGRVELLQIEAYLPGVICRYFIVRSLLSVILPKQTERSRDDIARYWLALAFADGCLDQGVFRPD
jgi:hypothetical protein